MPTIEQLAWGAESVAFATEFCALLPYAYAVKLWQAHNEFIEDLLNVITLP
jgi:hypothetical protein